MKILHFSDMHITTDDAGTQFDADAKIRAAIMDDLGKDGRTAFDAILVTGDIAYHGRAEEFARAKAWFEDVRKKTDSPLDSIYVIPGNHDVNRTTVSESSSLWDLHQLLRQEMSEEDRLASLNKKLHDPFDFLAALAEYRSFANEYGCPTDPNKLAWVHVLEKVLEDGTSVRLHGLNSALISDGEDKKGNLLLGVTQFHHFDADAAYINMVLCHHPHPWLVDGNSANDFFRNQSHLVLCGHDHEARAYKEDGSLRVFAGAVHPNPRERRWEPCYHVLTLSIESNPKRSLVVRVETRVWRDRDKCFGPHVQKNGVPFLEERIDLPDWKPEPPIATPQNLDSKSPEPAVSSPKAMTTAPTSTSDAYAAARRRLIVHFYRLGVISRHEVANEAGVWEESDDALSGQARWSRIFERAEKLHKFSALWAAVAAKDDTLAGQPNPFNP